MDSQFLEVELSMSELGQELFERRVFERISVRINGEEVLVKILKFFIFNLYFQLLILKPQT